jgi:small subunit ribosomal protein S4
MKKQHKKYSRPKNLFDRTRITSDKEIMNKYGLKNKSEIWKAESRINRIRTEAKKLIIEPEKQELFFRRLESMGLIKSKDATIDAVLSLTKENLLDRRLQTIVFKLGLAKTIKEARQLIGHRKIKTDHIITIPSYIVRLDEENKISLAKKEKIKTEKTNLNEIKEQVEEKTNKTD